MSIGRDNPLLWIGLTATLFIGPSFAVDMSRILWGNHDVWWTNSDMRLPLAQTRGEVEIYLAGKGLERHLADGSLRSVEANGRQRRITTSDVGVRLNNWNRVKASLLMRTTLTGIALGAALAMLAMGLVRRVT